MPQSKNNAPKATKAKSPKKGGKKSKSSKSTEPVVVEATVVDEPVVTEPVVAEPVVAEPVVAEPVVAEPVVAETASESSGGGVSDTTTDLTTEVNSNFDSVLSQLSTLAQAVRVLTTTVKTLQKNSLKHRKELSKNKRRKPQNKSNRAPSGFAKPTYLSNELCNFLNVELGTMKARTEVTKSITGYIKENSLQKPENKKIIVMDDKLESLLNPNGEEVTYFNMQKFMKVHFLKENPVA